MNWLETMDSSFYLFCAFPPSPGHGARQVLRLFRFPGMVSLLRRLRTETGTVGETFLYETHIFKTRGLMVVLNQIFEQEHEHEHERNSLCVF